MSKINDAKDAIHEAATLLERYRYQLNYLQAILFRIHKKHGNIELEVGEFRQDEMNATEFSWQHKTEGEEVVYAKLSAYPRDFETTAQELERRFIELMK